MWKLHEYMKLLSILTPFPLLCDVVWLSFAYLSGWRLNFKNCKSSYSHQIQKDTCTCITEDKIIIEWGYLQLLKINFNHSKTHNSANQHRIATGKVSKCAEEICAFWWIVTCISQLLIYLIINNCKDIFLVQFISY